MADVVLSLGIIDYLVLSGEGYVNNVSAQLATNAPGAPTTLSVPGTTDSATSIGGYTLLYGIQFDGVLSGTVSYVINGQLAGYAVQGVTEHDLLLSSEGKPLSIQIDNQSGQTIVYSFDFLTIPSGNFRRLAKRIQSFSDLAVR